LKVLKWVGIIIVVFIVIGVIAAASGDKKASTTAPGEPVFVVKVTGTEGTVFSGSYMLVTADGKSVSKSIDGTVPMDIPVDGTMVSVSFQKKDKPGTLKVEIFRGDKAVAESDTSAEYGVVTAASR